MVSRRKFLSALIAATVAPALAKSVPIPLPLTQVVGTGAMDFGEGDLTTELWLRQENQWHHHAQVRSNGEVSNYIDGVKVVVGSLWLMVNQSDPKNNGIYVVGKVDRSDALDEVRVSKVARPIEKSQAPLTPGFSFRNLLKL